MKQHFIDNGFVLDKHTLIEGAVGIRKGTAFWPQEVDSQEDWGLRPIFREDVETRGSEDGSTTIADYRGNKFSNIMEVNIIPIADLLRLQSCWDFIHIDIQGDEVNVCRAAIDDLSERVKYMVIATHSRKNDGDIFELFCKAGWILELEKPTRFKFFSNHSSLESMTTHDGTQVWRNPNLFD